MVEKLLVIHLNVLIRPTAIVSTMESKERLRRPWRSSPSQWPGGETNLASLLRTSLLSSAATWSPLGDLYAQGLGHKAVRDNYPVRWANTLGPMSAESPLQSLHFSINCGPQHNCKPHPNLEPIKGKINVSGPHDWAVPKFSTASCLIFY